MGTAESGYEGRSKKEILMLTRERTKLEHALGGIHDMSRVPSVLWIIDTNKKHTVVAEAKRLGISVATILGTNCDPGDADSPILGNDGTIRATSVLTHVISAAIKEGQEACAEHETSTAREATGDAPTEPAAENTDQAIEVNAESSTATETASVE